MAANESELQKEIIKIKSSAYDVRDYFPDLYKQLLPETLLNNDRISVVNELINEDTLPAALNKDYVKDGYVLLLYAHRPHNPNNISPINHDKNGVHSSLLLCKVTAGKINQILNIDGYNYLPFVDILGTQYGPPNPYIKNRLVVDVQDNRYSSRQPLQSPSWYNLNCLIYAFTFAKAIMNLADMNVIDDLFPEDKSSPSLESLTSLKQGIIQGVAGAYVKQVNETEFYRDTAASVVYHNGIRNKLAETVAARYHAALAKPEKVEPELSANTSQSQPSVVPISIFNKPDGQLPSSIAKLKKLCTDYKTHLSLAIRKLTTCDLDILILEFNNRRYNKTVLTEMDTLINKYIIVNRMLSALTDSEEPNEFARIHKMKEVLTPEAKEILSIHRSIGGQFLQAVLNVLSTLLFQNWKYRTDGEKFTDNVVEMPEVATP